MIIEIYIFIILFLFFFVFLNIPLVDATPSLLISESKHILTVLSITYNFPMVDEVHCDSNINREHEFSSVQI